nr:hypothetical protein [Tanacetum cinerariifolium]GEX76256.1 hypothetical protein [Tanacetum cinerariifolium]GEX76561.1 hypothetical protein [Tanacetum cinerariifolium]
MLYDGNVIAKETNVISIADSEETLMLEEESRSKMLLKQSDPMVLEKKVNIKLVNYAVLNQLSKDFGKRFVPQQELCAKQAFRFQMSNPSTESSDASPIKVDVPSELPKVSLVNASLKKLKFHLAQFDSVVKKILHPMLSQKSQEKDTVLRKLKERIKSLSGNKNVENVKKDIDEIGTINIELEHSVAKLILENENLRNEREHLKSIYKDQFDSIKKTRVQSKEHSESLIAQINAKSVENLNLNAQLQEKVFAVMTLKDELRKLKGKGVVDSAASKPNAVTIAPGMFKLNLEPLALPLVKNKDANINYIKHTRDNADILREIVETARALNPLDSNLDSACKSKMSTSACGSKPSGNTKNNRISQPSSSNKIGKVEDQPRNAKSRKNKKNRVDKTECNAHVIQSMLNANSISEPIRNAPVKHSMKNAKSECLCAICNKCLIDVDHAKCFIKHLNEVIASSKTKSKRNKKRKAWKPTGKVFAEIGYSWKPIGRNFTIVGNRCL